MDDIYRTPQADVDTANEAKLANSASVIKVYSPTQVACGTLGGPVGLVYFLVANFSALGKIPQKNNTLIWGVLSIIGLVCLIPFLPEDFPNLPFTIAYIVIARMISSNYQMTKTAISESHSHDFHSNWRVFFLSILCFLGTVIVLIVPLAVLGYMGVFDGG